MALVHLFGFGHTQSDDVKAKKPAPQFIRNAIALLKDHDVVIADKNNHLQQHRRQLREATAAMDPPVRLLALNWSLDKPQAIIHRVCGDRVVRRGDNHQSLLPDQEKKHEDVIWQFIRNAEELSEDEVDAVQNIDIESSLEDMLNIAVDACVRILGLERPSAAAVAEALNVARGYTPSNRKSADEKKKAKQTQYRYWALLPEIDLESALASHLKTCDFWDDLVRGGRVTERPHITLTHINNRKDEDALWDHCQRLHTLPSPPRFECKLGCILWNDRVMAVTVDDLVPHESDNAQVGAGFVSSLSPEVKGRLHITVGTKSADIPGVEAKAMVQNWRNGESSKEVSSVKLSGVTAMGRVKGMNN